MTPIFSSNPFFETSGDPTQVSRPQAASLSSHPTRVKGGWGGESNPCIHSRKILLYLTLSSGLKTMLFGTAGFFPSNSLSVQRRSDQDLRFTRTASFLSNGGGGISRPNISDNTNLSHQPIGVRKGDTISHLVCCILLHF